VSTATGWSGCGTNHVNALAIELTDPCTALGYSSAYHSPPCVGCTTAPPSVPPATWYQAALGALSQDDIGYCKLNWADGQQPKPGVLLDVPTQSPLVAVGTSRTWSATSGTAALAGDTYPHSTNIYDTSEAANTTYGSGPGGHVLLSGTNAYVQLNLGAVYNVNLIKVHPRTDLAPDHGWDSVQFEVSADGTHWSTYWRTLTSAQKTAEGNVIYYLAFSTSINAQWIRFRSLTTNPLNVAEMEVFGLSAAN